VQLPSKQCLGSFAALFWMKNRMGSFYLCTHVPCPLQLRFPTWFHTRFNFNEMFHATYWEVKLFKIPLIYQLKSETKFVNFLTGCGYMFSYICIDIVKINNKKITKCYKVIIGRHSYMWHLYHIHFLEIFRRCQILHPVDFQRIITGKFNNYIF